MSFEKFEGELGRLTRNNPVKGQLHYTPNNQFHLYIKVTPEADEVLIGRVIYLNLNGRFDFYDGNGKLIISVDEFDYGTTPIEFRQVGEYFTKWK